MVFFPTGKRGFDMQPLILACDLGTGGNKASLYTADGICLAETFVPYPTHYPRPGWHEQDPVDWWDATVQSIRGLLASSGADPRAVECLGISGHSLGVVPLDKSGNLLRESTPIWSDSRAGAQAVAFFNRFPKEEWYLLTGNGFPPALYPIFKIMWYAQYQPEMFAQIDRIIGTKDYINYRLTGVIATDYSYASGSGVYDLGGWHYADALITASSLPKYIFPEILPSTEIIGRLTPQAAAELGLPCSVKVAAGGVDNSCMALGARCFKEGRVYNSLGSSSWISVCSGQPLLNSHSHPYVFAHVLPDQFISSVSVFSAGTSFRWVRDQLCADLSAAAQAEQADPYDWMTRLAAQAEPGCRGLLFNPSLGGGSSHDPSADLRGAYIGLDLSHTRAELIRAAMEGVALELRTALDELRRMMPVSTEMLVVGGGSRSPFWRRIYADVLNLTVIKSNIDQQAAALGAAALAAVGIGLWPDFEIIDRIHQIEDITAPDPRANAIYESLLPVFMLAARHLAEIGDRMAKRKSG
jgi:xylulokinase